MILAVHCNTIITQFVWTFASNKQESMLQQKLCASWHSPERSASPNTQFNREEEINNQIIFLGVLVKREGRVFKATVYWKPTNTDRYMHVHHHPRVKCGTIKCLARRAQMICDNESKEKEVIHIKSIFLKNRYPRHLVSWILNTQPRQQTPSPIHWRNWEIPAEMIYRA